MNPGRVERLLHLKAGECSFKGEIIQYKRNMYTNNFIRKNNLAFICYDWLESLEYKMENHIQLKNMLERRLKVEIKDPKVRDLKRNIKNDIKTFSSVRIRLYDNIKEMRKLTNNIEDEELEDSFGETSDQLFEIMEMIYDKADKNPNVVDLVKNFVSKLS